MIIDIITLFPEMFGPLQHSIVGKAQQKELVEIRLHNLRQWAINDYGQVDDSPYGGEAGMVLRPEPLAGALQDLDVADKSCPVVFLTPQGAPLTQNIARKLSTKKRLVMICGHYKGIDQRVRDTYVTHEISIGDYVLTGGELPAMVLTDSIVRLLPGVLGNKESAENDSFWNGLLSWPVYTRPEEFAGQKVPDILLSGHHEKIKRWQREKSLEMTQKKRPDLIKKLNLRQED